MIYNLDMEIGQTLLDTQKYLRSELEPQLVIPGVETPTAVNLGGIVIDVEVPPAVEAELQASLI